MGPCGRVIREARAFETAHLAKTSKVKAGELLISRAGVVMSGRPGSKSLADQQKDFKRALLSSSAVTQSIAEARAAAPAVGSKNYAYGKSGRVQLTCLTSACPDHLKATASVGELHINSYLFSIISYLRVHEDLFL